MIDPLASLVADGVIDEVLSLLKTGKEAEIYLVRHQGEVLAAKVYKERHARSFKNNAAYKEGRAVRNSRTRRATEKGSRFGVKAAEEAWKSKESEALEILFAAGVRVPKPHLFYEGVLLMEAVVDAEGHAAPRIIDATIPKESAAALYEDLRAQMVSILRCDLIQTAISRRTTSCSPGTGPPSSTSLKWWGPPTTAKPSSSSGATWRRSGASSPRSTPRWRPAPRTRTRSGAPMCAASSAPGSSPPSRCVRPARRSRATTTLPPTKRGPAVSGRRRSRGRPRSTLHHPGTAAGTLPQNALKRSSASASRPLAPAPRSPTSGNPCRLGAHLQAGAVAAAAGGATSRQSHPDSAP